MKQPPLQSGEEARQAQTLNIAKKRKTSSPHLEINPDSSVMQPIT
jgi:hypothetical protein